MKKNQRFINIILDNAKKLGIKTRQIKNTGVYELKYKKKTIHIIQRTLRNSAITTIAQDVCELKNISKNIFKNNNINTPKWKEFYEDAKVSQIQLELKKLKFPIVIKPNDGICGKDIQVGVKNISEAVKILKKLQKKHKLILAEEMFIGDEIRVLATRSRVIAASIRRPASVLGDGKHTIKQLVKIKNKTRTFILKPLKINQEVVKKQGYKLDSIPKKGTRVFVQGVSNVALGGDTIDLTDKLHPSIKKLAIKSIKSLPDVKYAGLDFMTKDYTKAQNKNTYTIIEANAFPMISMHYKPFKGKPINTAREILKELFNIK